ncbi:MAG: two-component regulator propeller domain-containing protein [Bacteroidia bacterium]
MKPKNFLKYFFFLLLISTLKLSAQNYPQWYCLSHDDVVWDMAFDHDIAWIATRGGLVKYDRTTGAKTYYNAANSPLYSNEIKAVEVDDSGNVWIGAINGDLVKFDGTTWTHYWSLNGIDSIAGINEIHKDKIGNIYISSSTSYGHGLVKYDGTNFIDLACPVPYILSFSIDTLNNIWCGIQNELLKYDGSSWTHYDTLNSPFYPGFLNSVCADKNNNIWISIYENFGSNHKRIYYLNDTSWTYISPVMSGILIADFCKISADDSGNVFFYGDIDGVVKYDGVNFINYQIPMLSIPNSNIFFLKVDTAEHLWMLSDISADTIFYEFNGTNTIKQFISNSPFNSTYAHGMAIDHDGNRWFCPDDRGLQKFDGYNWTNYNRSNSNISSDQLQCVAVDNNNNIWAGAEDDSAYLAPVAKFDGNAWTSYLLSYFGSNPKVHTILTDKLNNIWFGVTGNGVARFDGSTWNYWNATDAGLNSFFNMGIAVDTNNNLWAGAVGSGLAKFSNNVWTKFDTLNSNILSNYVYTVFADHLNNIWFTTEFGLSKYDGVVFTNYGANNSNLEGFPRNITEDKNGNLWIGTNSGTIKYDGTSWTNFNNYNSGLGEAQVFDITVDKNNTKWICGWAGVWVFNENGIDPSYWHNIPQTKFEGKVFYDGNSNGVCDSVTEPGMINQKFICTTDSSATFSNSLGIYRFYRDSGYYESSLIPYANWNITSDSSSYHISLDTISLYGFDYGTYSFYVINDLEINLTAGSQRCNAINPFWIEYKNTGTTISTGNITFVKHDSLQMLVSVPPPGSVSGDTMIWNYSNLMPFESRNIFLNMRNPDVNSINDTLFSYITIDDTSGTNDSASVTQIISCSWDPNNKSVEPVGITPMHFTYMHDSLEYTIRFQNFGNDTAFSVFIIDSIPPTMQKDSFQFLASSHPVDIEISKTGVIRFMFNNIMLPSKDINEPACMGYVKYRLKPQQNMSVNTTVRNTAYIYFDLNPAIITNTVSNIYVDTITGIASNPKQFSIKAFPNPFTDYLNIQMQGINNLSSVLKVFDVTGRTVFQQKLESNNSVLRMNKIQPGIYFIEIENAGMVSRVKVVKN